MGRVLAELVLPALVLAVTLGPVAALFAVPGESGGLGAADWAAVRFTVVQAGLSALVSVGLAVPLARALARRRFAGRGVVVTVLGAPFLLPSIIAVFGLLAVFGRAGWVNGALAWAGLPVVSIYGLGGVVLAHVFLNLPLVVRMLLLGWQAIPGERFRLARSLDLGPAQVFRHLEAPMLRAVLPGAALVVFTLCLTSFAVALTLGGGPAATTVELAIYQALRFDGDLAAAARLALVQFALCGVAFVAAARLALPTGFGAGLDLVSGWAPGGWRRGADGVVIGLGVLFVVAPIAALVARGLPEVAGLPGTVWQAAGRSALVALAAVAVTMAVALPLALAQGRLAGFAATLPLASSSLVLGTGVFVLLRPYASPGDLALPVTVGVNALLALPFAFRLMAPEARALRADYGRLTGSLGLTAWARLRWVVLPRMARPLGLAAGLVAALAAGDLGVIALFAGDAEATLPLVVQRLLGAYRTGDAAGAALVLLALSFGLFAVFDLWGRRAGA